MASNTAVVSTEWGEVPRLLPFPEQIPVSRAEADIAAAVLHCHERRDEIKAVQRRWAEQQGTASAGAANLLAVYTKYLPAAGIRVEPA
jgi:hypothetical protein